MTFTLKWHTLPCQQSVTHVLCQTSFTLSWRVLPCQQSVIHVLCHVWIRPGVQHGAVPPASEGSHHSAPRHQPRQSPLQREDNAGPSAQVCCAGHGVEVAGGGQVVATDTSPHGFGQVMTSHTANQGLDRSSQAWTHRHRQAWYTQRHADKHTD